MALSQVDLVPHSSAQFATTGLNCLMWDPLQLLTSSSSIGVKHFDKVSHSILLSKLHNYGICGPMWHWISSFLNQRYQSVQFRGSSSNWLPVLSGVPQGSVLGPLLFNLFVLDLPNFVQSNLPQYADDTLLYRPIYSEDDATIMQKDLDNIISWCILNKWFWNHESRLNIQQVCGYSDSFCKKLK